MLRTFSVRRRELAEGFNLGRRTTYGEFGRLATPRWIAYSSDNLPADLRKIFRSVQRLEPVQPLAVIVYATHRRPDAYLSSEGV